jgi:hypothetical protein
MTSTDLLFGYYPTSLFRLTPTSQAFCLTRPPTPQAIASASNLQCRPSQSRNVGRSAVLTSTESTCSMPAFIVKAMSPGRACGWRADARELSLIS